MKAKQTPVVQSDAWHESIRALIRLLAPATPHISEELWQRIGGPYSVHDQHWPEWDKAAAADETVTLVVQVNGKVRERLQVRARIPEKDAEELALASPGVQRHMGHKKVVKIIYVPDKLINIVVS